MKRGSTVEMILDEGKRNTWVGKLFALILAVVLIAFIFWVFYRMRDYYGALEPLESAVIWHLSAAA